LKKIPRHEAVPDQFLPEQHNVGSESIGIPMHEFIVGPNPTVKSDGEDPYKQSKKKQVMLGFRNKRVG
jgi:hypothetical protein